MKGIRTVSLIVMAIIVAVLAMTAATNIALARNPNPGILPPNASPYGHTYGEWSATFFNWAFTLPVDHHPLYDTADCSVGQSGKVWFLDGTFAPSPVAPGVWEGIKERNCKVPMGKALFITIVASECSTLEGNGSTEKELRDCVTAQTDHVVSVSFEVDGKALRHMEAYRKQSPLYTFGPLPENNMFQDIGLTAPAGTMSPSVADGYYIMLAPLSRGNHTIHYTGKLVFTQAQDGFDYLFYQDITYHLTVGP